MIARLMHFSIAATLASATFPDEACDDLWFVRNAIFNEGGYCFATPLGRAVFDNADCTPSGPELSDQDLAKIAQIKSMEKRLACQVNTQRIALDMHEFARRQTLITQPIHDDTESSCIGYEGPDLPIFADQASDSQVIGTIKIGDIVFNAHKAAQHDPEGWSFVSRHYRGDQLLSTLGWVQDRDLWPHCQMVAG